MRKAVLIRYAIKGNSERSTFVLPTAAMVGEPSACAGLRSASEVMGQG